MPSQAIASCASCGYPLTAQFDGQRVACPYCRAANEAMVSQTNLGPWLIASGLVGLILGFALRSARDGR